MEKFLFAKGVLLIFQKKNYFKNISSIAQQMKQLL